MVMPAPKRPTIPQTVPDRIVAPGYMWMSGTSFAAPVVSGAAAQILALHPDWTPDQVKGALMLTAAYLPNADWQAAGVGEVDAAMAASLRLRPAEPEREPRHVRGHRSRRPASRCSTRRPGRARCPRTRRGARRRGQALRGQGCVGKRGVGECGVELGGVELGCVELGDDERRLLQRGDLRPVRSRADNEQQKDRRWRPEGRHRHVFGCFRGSGGTPIPELE